MPHLTPIQTARAIAKLEENWSLAAVASELHCSKTWIFNIKRRWQENGLERPIRIGVGKVYFHLNNVLITSQPHFY
jgi:transposase